LKNAVPTIFMKQNLTLDGSRRIIHANHLLKFYIRMQCVICNPSPLIVEFDCDSCMLISDQDSDFRELDVLDINDVSAKSQAVT